MMGFASATNGSGNGNGNGDGNGFPGFGPGLGDRNDDRGRGPLWQLLRLNGESVTWFSWLPNRRFAIYAAGSGDPVNHLVLDRGTGLVWQRSPGSDTAAWQQAHVGCANLTLGNVRGWRLPTLEELGTLEAPSNPTDFPTNHPFMNVDDTQIYWSATTVDDAPLTAYGKGFATGVNLIPAEKLLPHLFWCVRGGQGVHAQ